MKKKGDGDGKMKGESRRISGERLLYMVCSQAMEVRFGGASTVQMHTFYCEFVYGRHLSLRSSVIPLSFPICLV